MLQLQKFFKEHPVLHVISFFIVLISSVVIPLSIAHFYVDTALDYTAILYGPVLVQSLWLVGLYLNFTGPVEERVNIVEFCSIVRWFNILMLTMHSTLGIIHFKRHRKLAVSLWEEDPKIAIICLVIYLTFILTTTLVIRLNIDRVRRLEQERENQKKADRRSKRMKKGDMSIFYK